MTQAPHATLLVELLTEELPPRALARLGDAFAEGIAHRLAERDLLEGELSSEPDYTSYATPRRLAVAVRNVRAVAPDKAVRDKVLPVSVALDANGQPTAPLKKKLAALGFPDITPDELERASDGKNDAFFLRHTAPGATLASALQTVLDEALSLSKLPIPKVMTYQRPDGSNVQFVRPVHRLTVLHGSQVVPVRAFGINAGNTTLGHRFLCDGPIALAHADDYARALEHEGRVLANFAARRASIRQQLLDAAGNDQVVMPDALLDEVSALVEWPVVYACRFEDEFLQVPQECLILTMQTNQKYFALTDAKGRLRPRFLIVSNIATATPGDIIEGNERVVRPRLADAKFFFEQDRKKTLEARVPLLANVVYHNKLGSQLARVERLEALSHWIARDWHEAAPAQCGAEELRLAPRAARLAKADLLTDMVGEFPELQGTMGAYYARHDGEPETVARACSEHYQPRFSGDALPASATGTIVALADKLETLVGIWGIGLVPTGEKDPFALRRHALGVLRILLEKQLPLDLADLLWLTCKAFNGLHTVVNPAAALHAFCIERLRGLLRERGHAASEIDAVLALAPTRLDDIVARLDAVRAFAQLPEASALAAANKRISNILKKSGDAKGANNAGNAGHDRNASHAGSASHAGNVDNAIDAASAPIQPALLIEPAEQALNRQLEQVAPRVEAQLAARDYTGALTALAALRASVDAFFTDVMVNAPDPALRANRLALLTALHRQMNRVADISRLDA